MTPGKSLTIHFKIFCSVCLFSVTPAEVTFIPGEKLIFTFKLDPFAMAESK